MIISKSALKKIIAEEKQKLQESDAYDRGSGAGGGGIALSALMLSPVIYGHLEQIMKEMGVGLIEAAQYMVIHFPQEAAHMVKILLSAGAAGGMIHEEKKSLEENKKMKILKSQLKRIIKEEMEKMAEAGPAEGKQLYWVKYKEKDGSLSKSYMAVVDSEEDMRRGLSFGYIWHGFKPLDSFVAVPMTPEEQERFMAPDDSMEAEMYGIRGNTPSKRSFTYERPRGSLGS